jgi:hypothetical protein
VGEGWREGRREGRNMVVAPERVAAARPSLPVSLKASSCLLREGWREGRREARVMVVAPTRVAAEGWREGRREGRNMAVAPKRVAAARTSAFRS